MVYGASSTAGNLNVDQSDSLGNAQPMVPAFESKDLFATNLAMTGLGFVWPVRTAASMAYFGATSFGGDSIVNFWRPQTEEAFHSVLGDMWGMNDASEQATEMRTTPAGAVRAENRARPSGANGSGQSPEPGSSIPPGSRYRSGARQQNLNGTSTNADFLFDTSNLPLVLDYEKIEKNPGQYLNWYDAQQGDAPVIDLDWEDTLAGQVRTLYNQQNEPSTREKFDNFLLKRQVIPTYSAREGAGLFETGVNSAYNLVATGINTVLLPGFLTGEAAEALRLPPYMGGIAGTLPGATSTVAGARMAASSAAKGSSQTLGTLSDVTPVVRNEGFKVGQVDGYFGGVGAGTNVERAYLGNSAGHKCVGDVIPGGTGTAFAGHGEYKFGSGSAVILEGTAATLPREGIKILDETGRYIEMGDWDGLAKAATLNPRVADNISGMATYLPGAKVPNYTLSTPTNPPLRIYQNSTTVETGAYLDQLLVPDMGCVQWAACTWYSK